jgi:hypothetical protein
MTVESQLVPSGFDIIGYDEGGQPVDDASQALDFNGAISGVTVIDETRILVHGKVYASIFARFESTLGGNPASRCALAGIAAKSGDVMA